MTNLMRASEELFRRTPDECFPSLVALLEGKGPAAVEVVSPSGLVLRVHDDAGPARTPTVSS